MKTIIKILFACIVLTLCHNVYGQEGEVQKSRYDRSLAIGTWVGINNGVTYEVTIFPTIFYSKGTKKWTENLGWNILYKKEDTVIRKMGFEESDSMSGGLIDPDKVSLRFADNENKAGGNIYMTLDGDSATWIYRESGMPVNKEWKEAGKSDLPKTLSLQRVKE